MKCNCIEEANKVMAEYGARVETVFSLSLTGDGFKEQIYVPTTKIGPHKPKKKPPILFANYCPFCGVATGLKKGEDA